MYNVSPNDNAMIPFTAFQWMAIEGRRVSMDVENLFNAEEPGLRLATPAILARM